MIKYEDFFVEYIRNKGLYTKNMDLESIKQITLEIISEFKKQHPHDYEENVKIKLEERERKVIENQIENEKDHKEKIIKIVCNQTSYTKEKAIELLETYGYNNYTNIILKYMKGNDNEELVKQDNLVLDKSQVIYKEIRAFMDKASNNYYKL